MPFWLDELAAGVTFASPKSRILACPRLVTKMFAGLMSRWTMPSACAASSASAMSMAMAEKSFRFQRTPRDAVLQRHAVQKLHGDERTALLLANVVNRADVGVVQCGRGLCFTLKAGQRLRVSGDFIGQEFQGDKSAQPGVLGLVDDPHPAATELLDNAVVRDGLADHGIEPW